MSIPVIPSVIPDRVRGQVAPPHLAVEVQRERHALASARLRLQNRHRVVQVPALHIDLLAPASPVHARRTNAHLPRIERPRRRNIHRKLSIREALVVVVSPQQIHIGRARWSVPVHKRGNVGAALHLPRVRIGQRSPPELIQHHACSGIGRVLPLHLRLTGVRAGARNPRRAHGRNRIQVLVALHRTLGILRHA